MSSNGKIGSLQNPYRALSLLNSLLVSVYLLFLIDILNSLLSQRISLIATFLMIGLLKLYYISGISGCLLEVISGEEYVLAIRRVHQNAKALWPGFLIVFVIIRLVDFSLFSLFPSLRMWRLEYFSLLGTLAIYVLARWTIYKKYIQPLGLPRRYFKFDPGFFLTIVSAFLLGVLLMKREGFILAGDLQWWPISAFAFDYIKAFVFIFCSLSILEGYPEINENFSRRKEIFFINPMAGGVMQSLATLTYWIVMRSYPPFFVVLKALSPKTYQFREFNRAIWHERYYKGNVLVCITCFTCNSYEAYKIAKEFKKRGAKVVMGGPHVTYLPNEALAFCDSVVIGQAEGVWKEVVRDYENGALKPQYKGAATEEDHSQVHEQLLNSPPHIIKEFLETTRGCKFRCHFCTIPAISGGQLRTQSINDFVELIKKIKPHQDKVVFIDNNIYSDPGYARDLFIALKPLKIKWQSMSTIDIAKNQETLQLARESGCFQLLLGYEIFSGSTEKTQGGKFAMAQKYVEYTNIIKRAGINVDARFIFGFDSDSVKTLLPLWRSCFAIMPMYTVVSLLTPMPGSGVYDDMLAQDRIINLNWRNYATHRLVVRHPHLSARWMSPLFPLMQIFFLLTTSVYGFVVLVIIVFILCYCAGLFKGVSF